MKWRNKLTCCYVVCFCNYFKNLFYFNVMFTNARRQTFLKHPRQQTFKKGLSFSTAFVLVSESTDYGGNIRRWNQNWWPWFFVCRWVVSRPDLLHMPCGYAEPRTDCMWWSILRKLLVRNIEVLLTCCTVFVVQLSSILVTVWRKHWCKLMQIVSTAIYQAEVVCQFTANSTGWNCLPIRIKIQYKNLQHKIS